MSLVTVVDVIPGYTSIAIFIQLVINGVSVCKGGGWGSMLKEVY
jgi:hypothetical protein